MQGNNNELEILDLDEELKQTQNKITKLEEYKKGLEKKAVQAKTEFNENAEKWINESEIEEQVKKRVAESSKKTSIKPGCKVPNIREKIQVSKTKIRVGLGLAGICAAIVVSPIATQKIKENNTLKEALEEYQEDIVVPNTTFFINHNETMNHTAGHNHQEKVILEQLREEHENPIVIFYLFYQTLMKDEQCRNHYKNVWMQVYNNVNNTDYTSLEDFLEKNNFENYDELREYVALELQAENIRGGR